MSLIRWSPVRPALAICAAATVCFETPARAQVPITIHAVTGQPLPGEGDAIIGPTIAGPFVENGRIAFRNRLSDGRLAFLLGIPGTPTMAVAEGDAAPGLPPGTTLSPTSSPRLMPDGSIGFLSTLSGPDVTGGNFEAFWVGQPGSPRLLARGATQAPGVEPGVFYAFTPSVNFSPLWALSRSGVAAFRSGLYGPGVVPANAGAIFAGTPESVHLVARLGSQAPGFAPGAAFQYLYDPRVSASGRTWFTADVAAPGLPSTRAFFSEQNGAVEPVIRTGDAAPGYSDGTTVRLLTFPVASGDFVAASVRLEGPRTDTPGGILAGTPGSLAFVARNGDPLPGGPPGAVFQGLQGVEHMAVNAGGQVAFGLPVGAVFCAGSGGVQRVFSNGMNPGMPPGWSMGPATLESLALNAAGQIAAGAFLRTPGGDGVSAIVGWDPVTGPLVLAYGGQTVELSPGVSATLGSVWPLSSSAPSGGDDGLVNWLDDDGRAVFIAELSTGQTAVLTAVIPAPAAGPLLATGLLALRAPRRRPDCAGRRS